MPLWKNLGTHITIARIVKNKVTLNTVEKIVLAANSIEFENEEFLNDYI